MARHSTNVIEHDEHDEQDDTGYSPPLVKFMDRHNPANDTYMKEVQQAQRVLLALRSHLRPKQVRILKSVFLGSNYTEAAATHSTTPSTVSKLVRSVNGSRLLAALQHHQSLLDGPQEMQRRSMLWRIAVDNEAVDPKTAIKAVESLNKMAEQQWQKDNPDSASTGGVAGSGVTIIINQDTMPRGALD
tara:strand:+ start:428 stop:991 length:564 start_codon:yes stop_codon:yes gene_type:complete